MNHTISFTPEALDLIVEFLSKGPHDRVGSLCTTLEHIRDNPAVSQEQPAAPPVVKKPRKKSS